MKAWRIAVATLAAVVVAGPGSTRATAEAPGAGGTGLKTRNVILVTADGTRWQEVFGGADPALLNKKDGGVDDVAGLKKLYDRDGREARRSALMPFFWSKIAREGQVFGDAEAGREARVTNGKNFSYPGYNEIFAGFGDPRIDSNDKVPNPNITVLEWLNGQDGFRGKVAAFGTWDVFPYILNRERSGLFIQAGYETSTAPDLSDVERVIGALLKDCPPHWSDCSFDAFLYQAAREHLKRRRPRVLYLGLGDTDEWAHAGHYDLYLDAVHRADSYLKGLWETAQSLPEFRGTTTLIVTTDHGRGDAPEGWKHHGGGTKGSERIWIGVLGPDTPAKLQKTGEGPVAQNQIAATLAALLGRDFRAFAPKAGAPLVEVLPSGAASK